MGSEKKGITFYNWLGKKYDLLPAAPWLRYLQRLVKKEIGVHKGTTILDAGVGTGYFLSLFEDSPAHLYGIDIAQGMLDAAEKTVGAHVQLSKQSIEKTTFKSNMFDYVVSTEAFHHYKNPKKSLNEMYRITKKGGHVCIVDLFLQPLPLWRILFKLEPGYYNFYSKKQFKQMLEDAGFEVVKQKVIGGPALMTIGRK